MRYLLKTQPYEKPIAAGSFRYEQDGVPTGAVEHWRYSHALDGFKFFRVDVDARKLGADGYSTLYNVVIGPNGRAETVKFRHFSVAPSAVENGLKIRGQIDLEPKSAFVFREINGERFEEEFEEPLELQLQTGASWPLRQAQPPIAEPVEASDVAQLIIDVAQLIIIEETDHFRPVILPFGTEILETAESGYTTKVRISRQVTAVSTRLVIYR